MTRTRPPRVFWTLLNTIQSHMESLLTIPLEREEGEEEVEEVRGFLAGTLQWLVSAEAHLSTSLLLAAMAF